MRPELILASVLAVSVSALEARQAQQTSYPISQSEYFARKNGYEAGTVYTDQTGNYAGTSGKQGPPVAPNNVEIATQPKEMLLDPFNGIDSQIEYSAEGSTTGKVTSSVQAKETQILDAAGLNSTSTASSKSPRESGDGGRRTSQKGSEEKNSGASALLLGSGGSITVALIGLGLLLA